jgi:hypothetical protein
MDLDAIAPIVAQIVKDSLNEKVYLFGAYQKGTTNRVASGKLRDSIRAVVEDNKQGIQVIKVTAIGGARLEDTYAYWLINDRKGGGEGKFANINAIKEWIYNKKSFRIRDYKTGQFLPKTEKNVDSVAFVIARSVGRFGFQNKPKNFTTIALEKINKNEQIMQIVEAAAGETIETLLDKIEGL